jgi:hypothetical protein
MRALLVLAVLLSACGSGTSSSGTTTASPDTIEGPPRPWGEMTHEERGAYMARAVVPRMGALFAEYDAERYADLDCSTCHGPDASARGFEMPNPSLLPLSPSGTEGQRHTVDQYPEGVRFMFNRVVPTMRALLGEPEFDPATGEGFTCFDCHPHAAETEGSPTAAGGT